MKRNRASSMLSGMVSAAALGACSGDAGDLFEARGESGSNVSALSDVISSTGGGEEPFTTPLPIPPVLAPSARDATTDYYDVTIRSGLAQMRAGAPTPIVGFDGIAPGPTIVATRGRTVQVTQSNDWTEGVTVHNHGHKVAADSDGHPMDFIEPGSSKVYTYPNDQSAGTYWYHDHSMHVTGPNVYQGLAGFYLIRDPAEEALGLPSGAYDIPLLIQDKTFNDDNSLSYEHEHFVGFMGDTAVVNGAVTPYLDVGTRRFRFRVLNGSNARPLGLQLRVHGSSAAEPFQVIASDGGLLAAPVELSVLPIAPAERYDIVVDFAKYPVGTQLDLINTDPSAAFREGYAGATTGAGYGGPITDGGPYGSGYGGPAANGYRGPYGSGYGGPRPYAGGEPGAGWAGGPGWTGSEQVPVLSELLQFVVARNEADSSVVPSQLADIERHNPADAISSKDIVFRFDGEDWTMNDLTYDPERSDVFSRLDQVYIWSVSNESPIPHPFHKHLSAFNVLDINGQAPPSVASGWKDTVMVPPFSTVRILFKDETFTGTYVFHCHNLEHEDHGMMLQEEVTN